MKILFYTFLGSIRPFFSLSSEGELIDLSGWVARIRGYWRFWDLLFILPASKDAVNPSTYFHSIPFQKKNKKKWEGNNWVKRIEIWDIVVSGRVYFYSKEIIYFRSSENWNVYKMTVNGHIIFTLFWCLTMLRSRIPPRK